MKNLSISLKWRSFTWKAFKDSSSIYFELIHFEMWWLSELGILITFWGSCSQIFNLSILCLSYNPTIFVMKDELPTKDSLSTTRSTLDCDCEIWFSYGSIFWRNAYKSGLNFISHFSNSSSFVVFCKCSKSLMIGVDDMGWLGKHSLSSSKSSMNWFTRHSTWLSNSVCCGQERLRSFGWLDWLDDDSKNQELAEFLCCICVC